MVGYSVGQGVAEFRNPIRRKSRRFYTQARRDVFVVSADQPRDSFMATRRVSAASLGHRATGAQRAAGRVRSHYSKDSPAYGRRWAGVVTRESALHGEHAVVQPSNPRE
jgi:hypothetical protein